MSFVLDWSIGIIHVNARSISSMSATDNLNVVFGFICPLSNVPLLFYPLWFT